MEAGRLRLRVRLQDKRHSRSHTRPESDHSHPAHLGELLHVLLYVLLYGHAADSERGDVHAADSERRVVHAADSEWGGVHAADSEWRGSERGEEPPLYIMYEWMNEHVWMCPTQNVHDEQAQYPVGTVMLMLNKASGCFQCIVKALV